MLLVERALVESREKAKRLILAGQVFSGTLRIAKPSDLLPADAPLGVSQPPRFISRGGEKLDVALDYFRLDVRGATAIDLGASTGGFTDCLLQRGAARVFAVDVGRGQLAEKLRCDSRVTPMEKTNARALTPGDFPRHADLVTVDVSFISLTKVLPAAYKLLRPAGHLLALIKPQFEAKRGEAKKGVVRSAAVHRRVVHGMKRFAQEQLGARVLGVCDSPLLGPSGNREFFIGLEKTSP